MVDSSNIQLLDCTLRDGGYVNNFSFGKENISKIVTNLNCSGVEIIELGFLKNGEYSTEQTLFNFVEEAEQFVTNISPEQKFCLMIRPDWYDINKLTPAVGKIKSLRFAFHLKDLDLLLEQTTIAKDLGYKIMVNPVNILSYSLDELNYLLPILSKMNPDCVSIVDTFGSLLPADLNRIFSIFDNLLNKEIKLGLHLHENLSISLALSIMFVELMQNNRKGYIDSSINGMGRIPGNLCTELIMNFLNIKSNKNYDLKPIYDVIDNPISDFKKKEPWGYMPSYAITAYKNTHRSYAEFLMKKPDMSLNMLTDILDKLETTEEKENFSESVAEFYYKEIVINND